MNFIYNFIYDNSITINGQEDK